MKILVINGPNMNLLGQREPAIYGRQSYEDLLAFIEKSASALDMETECFQSNHEGTIVDKIQESAGRFEGIIINAAAYSHTSIAILDALKAVGLPAVEVHLSDPKTREAFRQFSYVALGCEISYTGLGFEGYRKALQFLKNKLSRHF